MLNNQITTMSLLKIEVNISNWIQEKGLIKDGINTYLLNCKIPKNFTKIYFQVAYFDKNLNRKKKLEELKDNNEKLRKDGQELRIEGEKLRIEGEKLRIEGEKLRKEGLEKDKIIKDLLAFIEKKNLKYPEDIINK